MSFLARLLASGNDMTARDKPPTVTDKPLAVTDKPLAVPLFSPEPATRPMYLLEVKRLKNELPISAPR